MRTILEREKARSDRNGHKFSLIIYKFQSQDNGHVKFSQFIRTCQDQVRSIDEVGWFGSDQICIVLPYTAAKNSLDVAKRIIESVPHLQNGLSYKVLTYPSREWPQQSNQTPKKKCDRTFTRNMKKSMSESSKSIRVLPTLLKKAGMQEREDYTEIMEPLFTHQFPFWKRAIDIVFSLCWLILSFPVFILISVIIKIVSPGPVFYKQERVGYLGERFLIWKFRTMKYNADTSLHQDHMKNLIQNGKPMEKLKDDNRIIPFGNFLRNSCLDELPQLINIFRGEMSLVGPRPDIPESVRYYKQWHTKRLETVQGLTGLWQVSGKNNTTFDEMVRLDISYIEKRSFLLDIKLMWMTLWVVFRELFSDFQKTDTKKLIISDGYSNHHL